MFRVPGTDRQEDDMDLWETLVVHIYCTDWAQCLPYRLLQSRSLVRLRSNSLSVITAVLLTSTGVSVVENTPSRSVDLLLFVIIIIIFIFMSAHWSDPSNS